VLVCWEEISESMGRKREEEGRRGERVGNLGWRVRVLEFGGSGGLLRRIFSRRRRREKVEAQG